MCQPSSVPDCLALDTGLVQHRSALPDFGLQTLEACRDAGVSHDSPRAQTCTFEGPVLQKPHQNSTRRPPERKKRHEKTARERKKDTRRPPEREKKRTREDPQRERKKDTRETPREREKKTREDPPGRREKERKWRREREKTTRNFGPPTLRPLPLWAPTLRAPHPSGPPTPTFSGCGLPHLWGPHPSQPPTPLNPHPSGPHPLKKKIGLSRTWPK